MSNSKEPASAFLADACCFETWPHHLGRLSSLVLLSLWDLMGWGQLGAADILLLFQCSSEGASSMELSFGLAYILCAGDLLCAGDWPNGCNSASLASRWTLVSSPPLRLLEGVGIPEIAPFMHL